MIPAEVDEMTCDDRARVIEMLSLLGENPYVIHKRAVENARRSRYYRELMTDGT